MITTDQLSGKISEIIHELKQHELWKRQVPEWVTDFSHIGFLGEEDFAGWLQFVFLPNLQHSSMSDQKKMVAPQAIKFFGEDVRKGKLLQLLIELDSLG